MTKLLLKKKISSKKRPKKFMMGHFPNQVSETQITDTLKIMKMKFCIRCKITVFREKIISPWLQKTELQTTWLTLMANYTIPLELSKIQVILQNKLHQEGLKINLHQVIMMPNLPKFHLDKDHSLQIMELFLRLILFLMTKRVDQHHRIRHFAKETSNEKQLTFDPF